MKNTTSDSKHLQDKHLANFAKFLTDSLVKPTVGKDTRLKDLEPLPYIVWKNGRLVKFEDTLPTIKSR